MLSKNQMVKHRRIIERLYDSLCLIFVSEEYTDDRGVTCFRDVDLYGYQPCRVSQSVSVAKNNHVVSETVKSINLYIAPELDIPAGSRVLVKYNDVITEYKNSGEPAKYDTYQKIPLEYVGRWV